MSPADSKMDANHRYPNSDTKQSRESWGPAGHPGVVVLISGWAASAAWGLGNNRACALLSYSARRPWGLQQLSGDQDPLRPENHPPPPAPEL